MNTRISYLDNLRTFMIFLVVLYHSAIVYQPGFEANWLVSDPVKSNSIGLIGLYINTFVMFILFFISGYFIPISLKNKTSRQFLLGKIKRIMIPWLVAVFTMIPAYKAIFLFSRNLPQEEWYSYFHLFQRAGTDLRFFSNNPTQHWLWFLPVLFLFQVLYLAMAKTKLLSVSISFKTAVLLTFVIGLIYSMVFSSLDLMGWIHSPILDFQKERLLVYFMVFLLGSSCYKHEILHSEKRNLKYYIISNVIMPIALTIYTLVALNLFFNMVYPERNYFYISKVADKIAYHSSLLLTMLSLMHLLIDGFRFYLNKTGKGLARMNKDAYYVYIIHMIIIGLFALILVKVTAPIAIKFPVLTLLAFVVSHTLIYISRRLFRY